MQSFKKNNNTHTGGGKVLHHVFILNNHYLLIQKKKKIDRDEILDLLVQNRWNHLTASYVPDMRLIWPVTFLSAEPNSWTLVLHLLRYSKFSVLLVKLGMSWSLGIRLDAAQRRDCTGTPRVGRAYFTFPEATSHHTGKKIFTKGKRVFRAPLVQPSCLQRRKLRPGNQPTTAG